MGRESGLRRYQSMDLMIWTVMLFLFETIVVKAGTVWFRSQPWTLSLVPALTSVVSKVDQRLEEILEHADTAVVMKTSRHSHMLEEIVKHFPEESEESSHLCRPPRK